MTSEVAICNRALQRLGFSRGIADLSENSPEARACNTAYEPLRDAMLRDHAWNFAKKRTTLAPLSAAPEFGYTYQFQLPSDYLAVVRQTNTDDWRVEGEVILSSGGTTLQLVYVAKITDPAKFDPLFTEALSARIAMELCETLTQSNTKLEAAVTTYDRIMARARRANAIERGPQTPPESTWITARR